MPSKRQDAVTTHIPEELRHAKLAELQALGRQRGMTGVSRMTKARLIGELMGQSAAYFSARLVLTTDGNEDRFDVEGVNHRWLRVRWAITEKTLERALAAMKPDRHFVRTVLRLHHVSYDESGPGSIEHMADFPIPGDALEWFVNTPQPGGAWKLELGLIGRQDRFFCLARSVRVQLPQPRNPLAATGNGRDERESHRRPFESGATLKLDMQGHLLVNGTTAPDATLTVDNNVIPVDEQTGEFQTRFPLGQGRQVVAVESATKNCRRRALLAVETHVRHLEPDPHGSVD